MLIDDKLTSANIAAVIAKFEAVGRQIPFAASRALNDTAKAFQDEERDDMAREFRLRRPDFVLRAIYIAPRDFATKDKLNVTIQINPAEDPQRSGVGARGRYDFLNKFEDGGEKVNTIGGQNVAIPTDNLKRNKNEIIPARLWIRNLLPDPNEMSDPNTKAFIIKSGPRKGIYQRYGRGGRNIRLLYSLKPSTPVPASLHFFKNAQTAWDFYFPFFFSKWFKVAVETAR